MKRFLIAMFAIALFMHKLSALLLATNQCEDYLFEEDSFPFTFIREFSMQKLHPQKDGLQAEIHIDIMQDRGRISQIHFLDTFSLMNASHTQTMYLFLNNQRIGHYLYNECTPTHTLTVNIPPRLIDAHIIFHFLPGESVNEFYETRDVKNLGIAFSSIKVIYDMNKKEKLS